MAPLLGGGNTSVTGDGEPLLQPTTAAESKHGGGWTTAPFIIGALAGLALGGGWMINMTVFLIQQFNIKKIDAAQIHNIVMGCTNFFPVIGAIVADSFLGCFPVIWISSLISLLGLIVLMVSVTIDGLKPPVCEISSVSNCAAPSGIQFAVLFTALGLVSIGIGGSRYALATIGANQFTKLDHQSTYFNWYFSVLYLVSFISATCLVYIEDNVSWVWGFGICLAANFLGLALFLMGKRYYRGQDKPKGSPFTSLLRVIVASVRKRKVKIPSQGADYYYGDEDDADGVKGRISAPPTNSFRVLNRAALKTDGDIQPNGTIANEWKVCTVQQVEDLKTLIKILPLWSTSILLGTPIGFQLSLTTLQALTTDRHLSPRFQVPAGSMVVFSFISTTVSTSLLDHYLSPLWKKLSGHKPTPLQQIGLGHVFTIASMAVSALVESKRRAHHLRGSDISVLWLVPQMVIIGIGEGFHFPGQVELYYQEFPTCLKSVSTAMVAVLIGLSYYSSLGAIGIVRRVTEWLPDDINDGRVDNVYWVMVVIGILNFGYYLVCSWFYKYKSVQVSDEAETVFDE